MNKINILLVDDEDDFRIPIAAILSAAGMEVQQADSPVEMDKLLASSSPDFLLLDVELPGESGFDIAKRLKQTSDMSIIMLTAYGKVEDRVEGLSCGADYYLPKPVDTRELIAVIQNIYQRNHEKENSQHQWELNVTRRILVTPDGQQHELVQSELQLLSILAVNPGTPTSRSALYAALGVQDYSPESRRLDNQVSRLRRRFSTESYTIPIKTVHIVGYVFNEPIKLIK